MIQRGNRRQETFLREGDYESYVELMAEWCGEYGVEILAWCLMPNHAHLIAVPGSKEALTRAIGEAHRRYTRIVNFREGWRGHLWQGRFSSFPVGGMHLYRCARYIEMNPVRAGLARRAEDWKHSSARAHIRGKADGLVRAGSLKGLSFDWREYLREREEDTEELREHERTGRPLGPDDFIDALERKLGRVLRRMKPGRKPKRGRSIK